ncbi:MAG: hypothetical protein IT165_07895 [Bryobacterales bacterium]|nr:hypothetical protein [Bryobacterales bacterium]
MTAATPLAPAAPIPVVFPISPPISTACTAALQAFSSLEAWLPAPATLQLPLHQIELQQELRGRQLLRILLQTHVRQRGTGDVGPALVVAAQPATALFSQRRLQRRTLKTIFGPIDIDRTAYCHDGAESIHPLDEALQLPARSFSYELQKRRNAWSRRPFKAPSANPCNAFKRPPVSPSRCAVWNRSSGTPPRTSMPFTTSVSPLLANQLLPNCFHSGCRRRL